MKSTLAMLPAALLAGHLLATGCTRTSAVSQPMANTPMTQDSRAIVSGTRIQVALREDVSSETATVGDAWHGFLAENVPTLNGAPIPAGTAVDGIVSVVVPARRGTPALIELGLRSLRVHGQPESVASSSEPVVGMAHARPGRSAREVQAATASAYERASHATRGGVLLNDGSVLSFRVSQTVLMH